MQELILIRGLPGSGKSTFAKLMCSFDCYEYMDVKRVETDMFFMQPKDHMIDWYAEEHIDFVVSSKSQYPEDFEYKFDATKLIEAHAWCQRFVRQRLEKNEHTVTIISNTFSRIWEMQPYLDMAKEFGAKVTVITCEGNFGNVHNVPAETIEKMRKRWEPYNG